MWRVLMNEQVYMDKIFAHKLNASPLTKLKIWEYDEQHGLILSIACVKL
jgi:hypothetical protein